MTLLTEISRLENKITEFKAEFTNSLLKVISAFSNYHDGKIWIGVNDNGEIVGVPNAASELLRIENTINDNIKPKPYYEMKVFNEKGLDIIEVQVYCGEHQPYLYKGTAYCRNHTAALPVYQEELKKLIMKGKNISFDEMLIETNKAFTFKFLRSLLTERLGLMDIDQDVLRILGLMKRNQFTNAAELFSDQPNIRSATIDLVRFVGLNVSQIMDRKQLTGMSILEQFDACIDFFHKHTNVQEKIVSAYRETIEEVPLTAFREAIANAIVHRDYFHNSPSRIEIYDDRIEVYSIGGLPYGINEEEYIHGGISIPRNYVIADIFLRLGIIEKLATGVRRIKEAYSGRTKQPEFVVHHNQILIILPKEKIVQSETLIHLDVIEELVVSYLKFHSEVRREDIEKLINKGKTTSAKLLSQMTDKGILIKIGSGRSTYYTLRK